jgi:flagellar basal-body rod modification protein FlgD
VDINTATQIEGINASKEDAAPGGALGKDEFLNLLMAQMRNQDPLDPMDSTASIAQLAQFSALEQMKNVSSEVGALRRESGIMQSVLLKDRLVLAQLEGGVEVTGVVQKVTWGPDGIVLTINGVDYPMNSMQSLSLTETAAVAPEGTEPAVVEPVVI